MVTDNDRVVHAPHGKAELCEPALRLYADALRAGRVARADVSTVPCLIELSLVHPDPWDDTWLRPVPPSSALAHLLQPVSREIDERLNIAATLSRSLLPLSALAHDDPNMAITVLEGTDTIQASINEASATATDEILTAQPGSKRPPAVLKTALANARTAIGRGARVRHIYQHPARYNKSVRDYLSQVPAQHVQVRTTELTVERLIIVDRAVAYIPASADRRLALRISHPALVSYLIQVYEVLWAQAVPLTENYSATPPDLPVTAVQRSIARHLTEGHVDDIVARRMGISVRTCRSHIARLMQTLGATSRTHLGALLVESGIVEAPATKYLSPQGSD
ncbi:helix-turn-helix transcriptional regulator [Streptomyces violaceoruber]|uniref:helix-turn-helix transcriptional regulator n=1 Tax=Streptomyces violaceoruber TaxID=1935 RepID=UPI001F2877A3|nr:helix-turn-helix transcriptional regulator [Streptomyces violaceoruber]MCF3169971.1 helix-turn-helix transcriptional regulator [Streptomyces violaceoruber]